MKIKLLFLLLFVLTVNTVFSNENSVANYLKVADSYKLQHKYTKAINYYIKAVKTEIGNDEKIKAIYFDIADCFYKSGKKNMAIKVLKFSIYRYGAIKSDILSSPKLDKDFSIFAMSLLEEKYDSYRNKYVSKINKELEITNEKAYVVKSF